MRDTYSVKLNDKYPDEAALMQKLAQARSQSELIKVALLAYFEQGNQPPIITEQELAELRMHIAYLEQNQGRAPAMVPAQEGQQASQPAMSADRPLSETFLNAVRAAARPGIRLE
jgi:hypothetical protein